jgi:hypothetical protein
MKCDLLCAKCGKETRERFSSLEPFTGEYVSMKRGISKGLFLCDWCGKECFPQQLAVALTIFTAIRPYMAWESGYLTNLEDYPPGAAQSEYGAKP